MILQVPAIEVVPLGELQLQYGDWSSWLPGPPSDTWGELCLLTGMLKNVGVKRWEGRTCLPFVPENTCYNILYGCCTSYISKYSYSTTVAVGYLL
jgi:hypothetical protein